MKSMLLAAAALFAGGLLLSPAPARADGLKFEHVLNIGTEGTGEGQFKYVEDFAWTKDGKLLATDAFHAWVQVFDPASGKFITRFGGKGDDDQHLDKPEGIAVDPAGNIFVADYNTGFVKKYDASYKWLSTFSEYGTAPGQNIKSEFMDIRDGKLFMPEAGNHRVNVFDLNGKFLYLFGGLGTEPGKMNNPEAARFASDGRLYVSDLKNDRMQVFSADGKLLFGWGKTGDDKGEFKAPAWPSMRRTASTSRKSVTTGSRSSTRKASSWRCGARRAPATASSATCTASSSTRRLATSTSPTPPTTAFRCSVRPRVALGPDPGR